MRLTTLPTGGCRENDTIGLKTADNGAAIGRRLPLSCYEVRVLSAAQEPAQGGTVAAPKVWEQEAKLSPEDCLRMGS